MNNAFYTWLFDLLAGKEKFRDTGARSTSFTSQGLVF